MEWIIIILCKWNGMNNYNSMQFKVKEGFYRSSLSYNTREKPWILCLRYASLD